MVRGVCEGNKEGGGMKHEPGILEFPCYVCKKNIAENPVHIGEGIFKHRRCAPGTKKWMASEVGMKSPYREFFTKGFEK